MTRESFEKILEDKGITWNDIVTIVIINPFKRRWKFWEPASISFKGALGYIKGDNVVNMCIEDPINNFKSIDLYFDFEQIIGIKKHEKTKRV